MLVCFVRTTVELPDPLFCELKALAAYRGTPSEPGSLDLTNAEIEEFLT